MQIIVTHGRLAHARVISLPLWKLLLAGSGLAVLMLAASGSAYHFVVMRAASENWPVAGQVMKLVIKDETAQRERFMRENLDAMARKLGEMQAKMVQLEALGERVSGLAGVTPTELKVVPGRGGALIPGRPLTLEELQSTLADLDRLAEQRTEVMTVMESRLFDLKVGKMMVPTQKPVFAGNLGSAFGWRIDPFTGRSALHTGLDFQADPGTSILSAAGGVVVTQEHHPAYGQMVEVDHGNDLVTRYAHASRVWVKTGDLVKRGQRLAEVGTTGRSTGPHLHFEVLVRGVPQDPQKFLAAGHNLAPADVTRSATGGPVQSASRR